MYYTPSQLAVLLRVSKDKILYDIRFKKLKATRIKGGYMIDKDDIFEYLISRDTVHALKSIYTDFELQDLFNKAQQG